MLLRKLLPVLLAASLCGCQTPYKKKDAEERQPLKNVAGDTSFQAFVGRLRKAVKSRDVPMIASLMAADFGYTWDQSGPASAQVFAYWDENGLWPALESLLSGNFVPSDLYMVAPPALVGDPTYNGPRCGMRIVGGSWRFAYFLPSAQP